MSNLVDESQFSTNSESDSQKQQAIINFAYSDLTIKTNSDNQIGSRTAKCKFCSNNITDTRNNTSNFIRHLKFCDKEAYDEFKSSKEQKKDKSNQDHKKNLTAEIVNDFIFKYLIIGCGLPYRLVECEAFRSFMSLICKKWKPTSRTNILKLQNKAIDLMNNNLKLLISKIRFASLTLDVWTDRRLRSFLGITIHFLDENFNFKTYVLRCKNISTTTGWGIKREIDIIIEEFAIREKLVRIVTDNGSNMVKMGTLLHLVGEDEFDLSDREIEESETDTEGEVTSSEDEIDTNFNIDEIDLLQDSGLKHMRCFAHSLQLVVKKSLAKINNVKRIIRKCTKISAKYRQKKDFASYLAEKKYNSIPKPIKVRWNSELKCLRAICKIKLIDLNEALNMINNQGLNLSQNEHSRLAEIINILEPFEFVTNEIQGDQYSTLSLVVPSLLQLIQHLNDFKLVNNSLKAFISELRNEINTRFSVILDLKNNSIVDYSWYISSFLDPLFKNEWLAISSLNSDEKHLFIKRLEDQLFQEWKIIAAREGNENNLENQIPCTSNDATKKSRPLSTISTDSEASLLKSPTKRRKFFSFLNRSTPQVEENDDKTKFKHELEQYINIDYNEDDGFTRFWMKNKLKLPALSKLAQKFLSIPASSGPVERLFSKSGYINRPHRSRLTAKNLKATTLLVSNMDLLNE